MKDVDTRHKDYDKFSPKWKRARDAMAGQDAVHAARQQYLPKLRDQEDEDYSAYLKRAGFYNATWRTVSGLLGMLFRKPPGAELPAAVETFAKDIDMAGMSLDTFARKAALEVIGLGRVGIMVDHPAVENVSGISLAAAESQGMRPMLKCYKAETIINWKYARIRNFWMLSMVVLEETVEEAENEFKAKSVMQWRVLDLDEAGAYRQRIFRKAVGVSDFEQIGDDVYPMIAGKRIEFIPFFIVGTDGIDSDLDEPPLIDLIDLNLSHYRTNADYEHGCHFTGLPTLFLKGFVDSEGGTPSFYIGSQAAIVAAHTEADGKYIEFTGQGLSSLRENLDRKETQMAVIGARMLFAEKRQVEAAETASIHRQGENSVLAALAQAISDGLTKALTVFTQWAGASGTVSYELNRDFNPALLGAQDVTAYMKAVQSGLMSEESFFTLLQRGDVVDSELTWADEQERIGQQGPALPADVTGLAA